MFVTRGVLMEYFKNSYGLQGWKKKKKIEILQSLGACRIMH